jgi:eukaryotic-like serine/threonine-protein kinase
VSRDDTEEILFDEALALPEADRNAFLARRCAGRPGLRRDLEALIAAQTTADEIERCVARRLEEELAPAGDWADLVGTTVGPYQVTGRLGEGGTGIVYRAEQAAPFRRTVALKVVKPGMDTREVLARFAGERQALALMNHPGIARVFDAGATPQGRGFFVMELVEGVPLTRHCDEHALPLDRRLGLFAQVCQAVQHAHQKGILHRDLKPSNILVVSAGGEPQPKIIDFGIAKALSPDDAGALAGVTQLTQLVGTPGYMSPEQAAGSADLDTRSDVYSLGVVLYELVAGRTPHDPGDWARAGFAEMRRRIREEEPARPSAALARTTGAAAARLAATRGAPPDRLAAAVRGELDWIILRCLAKDRNRRYASAAELAEDLRRFRDHEPVTAAAPGRLYVLRKSLRRHRLAYAAGAAAVLGLAAATAVSSVLAIRARRAEQVAAAQSRLSQAVTDFLRHDVLAEASPNRQPDRDLRVRAALDNAAARIGDRFAAEPLTEASIRETLGETYNDLGEYEKARVHFARAWSLRRLHLGPDARPTLAALNSVVRCLRQLSRFAEAERLAGDALARQTRAFGRDDPLTLDTLAGLGAMRLDQGRPAEAVDLLSEALARRRRTAGDDDLKTLQTMNNLAMAQGALGREPDAIALFEESLAHRRRKFGPEHPHTINILNNLAASYSRSGETRRAGEIYEEVLAIRTRVQGPEHPDTLHTLQNLGSNRLQLGRLDEAFEILQRARAGLARALGPDHPQSTMPLMNLGVLRTYQGRFAEAEAYLRECADLRRARLGPDHFLTTDALAQLGETLGQAGRIADGERLLREVLERRTRAHGADSFRTLTVAHLLGCLLLDAGRTDEAGVLLLATARRALDRLGSEHPQTWNYVADAMRHQLAVGQPGVAEELGRPLRDSDYARRISRPTRWLVELRYGGALLALGRRAEAAPLIRAGYDGLIATQALLPPNERDRLAEARGHLADLQRATVADSRAHGP